MALDPNYGTRVREYAQERYPAAFDSSPYGVPNAPAGGQATQPQIQEPQGPTGFPKLVLDTQGEGPRLGSDQLEDLRSRYIAETLIPREAGRPGSKQMTVQAAEEAFNSASDRWIQDYLTQGQAESLAGAPDVDGSASDYIGDFTRGLGASIAQLAPAAAAAGDYGLRAARGAWGAASGVGPMDWRQAMGDQTALGRWASDTSEAITRWMQEGMSERGQQATQRVSDAESFGAALGEIVSNPAALAPFLGQGVGSLTPLSILRVPRVAQALRGLSTGRRAAAGATIAGAPPTIQMTASLEGELRGMSLSELLEDNPDGQALYESLQLIYGDDENGEAAKRTKDHLVNQATAAYGAIAAAANVGLATVPGIRGAEGMLAGATRQASGRIRGALGGAASEAGQEGLAEGLETVGENIAGNIATGSDTPLLEGAGPAAAVGGTVGGLIGGGVGAMRRPNPLARRRGQTNTEPEATDPAQSGNQAAPAPATGEPAATAAPGTDPAAPAPAPLTGVEAVTTNPGQGIESEASETLQQQLRTSLSQNLSRPSEAGTRQSIAGLDPESLIEEGVDRAQTLAGDQWANMTAEQRLESVETAVETLRRYNRQEGVAEALEAYRAQLEQPAVTPAGPVEQPPTETAPVEPEPEPEPTPAPTAAPTPPRNPLARPPAPPAPTQQTLPIDDPPAPEPTTETPPAETPPAETPATETPRLPRALAGARPRYGAGIVPEFESDIDKALYVIGRTENKSKSDSKYRAWLVEQGFPEGELDNIAQGVRQQIVDQLQNERQGTSLGPRRVPVPSTGTTPPFEQAPVEPTAEPGQEPAQTEPSAPTEQTAEQPPAEQAQERESIPDAIARITPEAEQADIAELTDALMLAREGDSESLTALLRSLMEDDVITPEQARLFREAGRETTPAEEGLTASTEPEPTDPQPWDEGATVEQQEDSPAIREVMEDAQSLPNDGSRSAAVLRGIAALPELTRYQKWMASRLADIIEPIGVKLTRYKSGNTHGTFTLTKNTVNISTARASTVIHEYLHAATVSLLYRQTTDPAVELAQKNLAALTMRFRQSIQPGGVGREAFDRLAPGDQRRVMKYPAKDPNELLTYGLTDPAARDLMAQLPPTDLGKRSGSNNLWQEFRDLLSDMWAAVTGADPAQRTFLDSVLDETFTLLQYAADNPAQMAADNARALYSNEVSKYITTLDALEPEYADGLAIEAQDSKPAAGVDTNPVTRTGRFIEQFARAALGIEDSVRAVLRANGKVTPENNPDQAATRFTSDIAENRNLDNREFVEPIRDWITENAHNPEFILDETNRVDDFKKQLDKFLQTYHALNERNPTVWAEQVPLMGRGEVRRSEVMARAFRGESTPEQTEQQLQQIANQYATQTVEEWASASPMAVNPEAARKILADLDQRGFNTTSLSGLNSLLERARQREHYRRVEAGLVSENDPFARRPSWQWYVPLRNERQQQFNLGIASRDPKQFAARNLKTLKGRQTVADNALESLVMDLNAASMEAAERNFKGSLYEYVLDNQEILGAEIREIEGTPKGGYSEQVQVRNKKTGKMETKTRSHKQLPNPQYGFVYNQGDRHYIVELPEGSRLDAGVKGLRSVISPHRLEERQGVVGTAFRGMQQATNVMARSYTTWSPDWQLFVGFLRDIQTLPATIAIDQFKGPGDSRQFLGTYFRGLARNTFSLPSAGRELRAIWENNRGNLRDYAQANPESYAASLVRYREAGGSTEWVQSLNRETVDDALFGQARRDEAGMSNIDIRGGYDRFNQLTADWAAMLENKGRVAAFQAMAEVLSHRHHNVSWDMLSPEQQRTVDREAAAIAKSSLDYGQSGEWGKMINAAHAFYRVGATQVDVIRRAFTRPEGGVDTEKLKSWMPFFTAMGAINYMLVAAMLGDDEEGTPRIKKYSPNTLVKRMILPVGGDKVVGMSIGLGLPQMLLAPGTLGAAYANGHITATDAADAYYDMLTSANLPLSPAGWEEGTGTSGFIWSWGQGVLVPTVLDPVAEVATNVNAFDRPIHTSWPQQGKFKSDSGMPHTPQKWTDMAKWLREITSNIPGTDGLDMYPEDIRHYVNGYGGQIPRGIQRWTVDRANREEQGAGESSAVRLATRGEVRDEEFYYRNEARRVQGQLQVSQRLMRSAAGDDKSAQARWRRENPNHRRRLEAKRALDRALDRYYDRRNEIRNNSLMSAQGKRDQNKRADSDLRRAVDRASQVLEATE